MDLLSVIRRWHFRQGIPIREIGRRTALSRNTIRKYLRSDILEPVFKTSVRPGKLDEFADKLAVKLKRAFMMLAADYGSQCPTSLILMR